MIWKANKGKDYTSNEYGVDDWGVNKVIHQVNCLLLIS